MAASRQPDEMDDPVISIGVLAQKVGLSVSSVRKYEREGLIIAHRTEGGHRLFSHDDVERVRNVHHMIQDLGLNFEGIRRMQAFLPCCDLLPCSVQTRESCPAYHDVTRPCWMIQGLDCAPKGNECRRCIVYRLGSLCTLDIKRLLIKRLLTHQDDLQDRSPESIRKFLESHASDRQRAEGNDKHRTASNGSSDQ